MKKRPSFCPSFCPSHTVRRVFGRTLSGVVRPWCPGRTPGRTPEDGAPDVLRLSGLSGTFCPSVLVSVLVCPSLS